MEREQLHLISYGGESHGVDTLSNLLDTGKENKNRPLGVISRLDNMGNNFGDQLNAGRNQLSPSV